MNSKKTIKFIVNSFVNSKDQRCDLEVYQDGVLKFNLKKPNAGETTFEFDGSGKSTEISFVVKGKSPKYSLLDKSGKIISDTAFQIKKILLGQYDYTNKINLFSNYYIKNNTIRTNGFMGYNGTYNLKIRLPLSKHMLMCDFIR